MRKIFLALLVIVGVLMGCNAGTQETSIVEVRVDEVSNEVQNFINDVTIFKEEDENGIYVYSDTDNRLYLYLSQEFLGEGKSFGDVEIKAEVNSINIYLSEDYDEEVEPEAFKLYEINLDKLYEYLRVFKNNEETYFEKSYV